MGWANQSFNSQVPQSLQSSTSLVTACALLLPGSLWSIVTFSLKRPVCELSTCHQGHKVSFSSLYCSSATSPRV